MAQIWNKCTFLSVVLLLNVPLSGACFPGGQMVRRRPRRENPLLYNEHVPNTPEHSMEAAGRPEKPIRGASDPRYNDLVENYNENIIFKDKEDYSISRKMSRRCKEKLDTLAMLVMNQWPGVKLRVLKAWVQNKDFRPRPVPNSVLMHYEGRALDLTTSDMDRPKIGALARLAVQSGFDWVHFEHKSHIHVSVKSDILSRSTRSLRCFPGSSVVMNSDHKRKFMSDLNIGDQVTAFSMHTGQIVSSPIVAFLHLDTQTTINDYLRIRLSNSSLITLSPDHLLLSLESTHATNNESTQNSISCAKCTMKMARKLNFGDYVVTFGGKKANFYESIGN